MKEKLEPLVISFGDVFIPSQKTGTSAEKRFVILSIDDGGSPIAHRVETKDGVLIISGMGGTTERKDIQGIKDNLSLEEILQGLMNYYDDTEPTGKQYDLVREAATLGSISL